MALRTTVSRIAARGVAAEPAASAEEVSQQTVSEESLSNQREEAPPAEAPKRRGRGPGRPKKAATVGVLPPVTGNESAADIRAQIKTVETTIKEARARHDEEMKALKTVYADLHSQLFYHVK